MTAGSLALSAVAALPIVATVLLLLKYRWEALCAARYLGRARPVGGGLMTMIILALLLLAIGCTLLFGLRDKSWAMVVGGLCLLVGGTGTFAAIIATRLSVFSTVAALGLALGVAALVVVGAVTSGFRRDFLERVTPFHGHVMVGLYGEPALAEARAELATLATKLTDLPGLVSQAPFGLSVAEVSLGPVAINLKAIDGRAGRGALNRWLVAGDLSALARPAACGPGVTEPGEFVGHLVIGRPLAERLRAKVGDCVPMVIPFGRPGELIPEALYFQVVGIFEMGFHQHDTKLAFVALDDLARLEAARPFIYGIELVFDDPMRTPQLLPQVEARIGPGYRVLDWRFLSHMLFATLETQRVAIGFFLCIILLVSAFNLVASLIIVVVSKTREIAVLRALGARPAAVLRIFVIAGGIVGLVGTTGGLAMGLAVAASLRAMRFKIEASVYRIGELPIDVVPSDLLWIMGIAQITCLAATIAPVIRARRLQIVDGLRQV